MAFLLGQLLREIARLNPEREAIRYGDQRITYGELNRISDQLAQTLMRHGVKRGDRVGVCLNKSIEAVVAIFGILKSGAAYVPLDNSSPAKRLVLIIADSGMRALVTSGEKAQEVAGVNPELPVVTLLILTNDTPTSELGVWRRAKKVFWKDIMNLTHSESSFPAQIDDDLAYILYTSGSTGTPKGVMISHRASMSFVNWAADYFQLTHEDRISNQAPLHFDLSTFDIFASIKVGATIVLISEELSSFPVELVDFMEAQKISIWYSVPSVLTRLLVYGKLERYRFNCLRKVLFAGEVFPLKYLRQVQQLIPQAEFYNLYGPTETNVCTVYPVGDLPDDAYHLPIGKACAHTEVWAFTDKGVIAESGEISELSVRGPCVMKGYWGMPEKTREVLTSRAVPPRGLEERVYRTGDLVKRLEDGNYIFIGRRDEMIKSRGHRIELGEIESILYTHPAIEQAAVIAVPAEEIGNTIKAIVVLQADCKLREIELRHFCSERLPRYMIPEILEFRAALPMTATGKVNKSSLIEYS